MQILLLFVLIRRIIFLMRVFGLTGGKDGRKLYGEFPLLALNGLLPRKDGVMLLTGQPDGISGKQAGVALHLLNELLRSLVDSWIDSAKSPDDESPWERIVPAKLVLQDYIWRNPPVLIFGEGASRAWLPDEVPSLLMWPHNFIEEGKKGAFAEEGETPILRVFREHAITRSLDKQLVRTLLSLAFDAAAALFLQLLDSPARTRLFRCDGCQKYFMRTRTPKKDTPIFRGSYCAECKGKGAARRTTASRNNRTEEMIGWAADVWEQWRQDRRHGEREDWVARKINAWLPASRNPIARNWVTRNRTRIEVEVERRNHATRKN